MQPDLWLGNSLVLQLATLPVSGGDMGTRTPDLRVAGAALFQLSYVPSREAKKAEQSFWLQSQQAKAIGIPADRKLLRRWRLIVTLVRARRYLDTLPDGSKSPRMWQSWR